MRKRQHSLLRQIVTGIDMQLAEFEVLGLFGRYDHRIKFPISKAKDPRPSLVILHGGNGVGKTTILRMIDGFMRLDFDVFRENPFRSASLKFTTGKIIQVVPVMKGKKKSSLQVTFDRETVSLHPNQSGPVKQGDEAKVENFREKFLVARESLIFEFIDTSRIIHQRPPDEENAPAMHMWQEYMRLQAQGVN